MFIGAIYNIGGVGVHLHDGFASVFHHNKSREVEYADPDALDKIAKMVEEDLKIPLSERFLGQRYPVRTEGPTGEVVVIKSQEELEEFMK